MQIVGIKHTALKVLFYEKRYARSGSWLLPQFQYCFVQYSSVLLIPPLLQRNPQVLIKILELSETC